MVLSQLGHQNYNNMLRIKTIFIAAVCLVAGGNAFAVPAIVRYIVDGDTFSAGVKLEDDTIISVRVRLRNVDTPELHGQCIDEIVKANVARTRLSELIPVDSVVELQNIKDDKYLGRIDANVLDAQGRDVGKILVDEGLGRSYGGGKRSGWCEIPQ